MSTFAAIDFETADRYRDSACAVGVVLVENRRLTERYYKLIRPPRKKKLEFTHIHGLAWKDVRNSPSFGEVWPDLRAFIDQAEFLVAHNAPFDRGVLHSCCEAANVVPPSQEFRCTLQMARAKVEPAFRGAFGCLRPFTDPAGSPQCAVRRGSLREDRREGVESRTRTFDKQLNWVVGTSDDGIYLLSARPQGFGWL